MFKYLAVATIGVALSLGSTTARAHDEAAYFVLGTLVGATLTTHSSRHAHVVAHYPAPRYVYAAPARHVVVYQPRPYRARHYYAVPPPRDHWKAHHGHRHHGPPGQRRYHRGR